MPAKISTTESDGFSAEERAAMKERAAELRAEGKKGAKKADGLQEVLDSDREDGAGGSRARRARAYDGDRCRPGSVAEDLVRDARLRERGRQGRRLLPGLRQVQLPVLDPRASRTRPTSTTATCGRCPTRCMKWSPAVEKKVVALVKAAVS